MQVLKGHDLVGDCTSCLDIFLFLISRDLLVMNDMPVKLDESAVISHQYMWHKQAQLRWRWLSETSRFWAPFTLTTITGTPVFYKLTQLDKIFCVTPKYDMSSLTDNISTAVFFDPVLRRIAKIYLDTKHLTGQIYIRLRSIIESGGGRITPMKEAASIWIVAPEAPNALGDPPLHITVLYAPWLVACSKKGYFLGAEHGDWCGFRVPLRGPSPHPLAYPEPEPTPAPKPQSFPVRNPVPFPSGQPTDHSRNTGLNVGEWSLAEISEALKYPSIVPQVPVWNIDLTGCPNPPHVHMLDLPNSVGRRTYSDKELAWITNVIQWCLSKYPDMPLSTVVEVLARKGSHRSVAGYDYRMRRHLAWFTERAPLLAERLQDYVDTLANVPIELSDSGSSLEATPQLATRDSRGTSSVIRVFTTEPKSTRFTAADRAAFIQFAAARPSGINPTGTERAGDVWAQFARKHPHHSIFSWRTWHQHWQHDLKRAVEEYRKANSGQ
ncbi:unnamed protein product [Rhizoctonia solani]|uniref:Uncharacterized protein n=1 Tax=Rhizoctonia solani TaxID=456999 RepID=A0A8H3AKC0_9AGAM|nr:unnamed protein product [Rhizoctonia solani]